MTQPTESPMVYERCKSDPAEHTRASKTIGWNK